MILKLLGSSFPSMDDKLYTLDLILSTITYGHNQLGLNFPFISSFAIVLFMFFFSTKYPTLNSLILIFLTNSLWSFAWYTFWCSIALIHFLSNSSNYCNLDFLTFSFKISPCRKILREGISNSNGTMTLSPYINKKKVSPIAIWTLVW